MNDGEILSLQELQYAIKNSGSFDLGDFNYDTIETVLNLIEKQQEEIEKKDKIIDLMAEEIASYNHYEALGKLEDKEDVIEYFNQKIEKGE